MNHVPSFYILTTTESTRLFYLQAENTHTQRHKHDVIKKRSKIRIRISHLCCMGSFYPDLSGWKFTWFICSMGLSTFFNWFDNKHCGLQQPRLYHYPIATPTASPGLVESWRRQGWGKLRTVHLSKRLYISWPPETFLFFKHLSEWLDQRKTIRAKTIYNSRL